VDRSQVHVFGEDGLLIQGGANAGAGLLISWPGDATTPSALTDQTSKISNEIYRKTAATTVQLQKFEVEVHFNIIKSHHGLHSSAASVQFLTHTGVSGRLTSRRADKS